MTEQTTPSVSGLTTDLLKVATEAADTWAIANRNNVMSAREVVAGIVEAAVMHLVEEGLLLLAPDIRERVAGPINLDRQADAGALDDDGRERVIVRGASKYGTPEGELLTVLQPCTPFRVNGVVNVYPTDGLERHDGAWWRVYRPAVRE